LITSKTSRLTKEKDDPESIIAGNQAFEIRNTTQGFSLNEWGDWENSWDNSDFGARPRQFTAERPERFPA
jgi:hypothetical protein